MCGLGHDQALLRTHDAFFHHGRGVHLPLSPLLLQFQREDVVLVFPRQADIFEDFFVLHKSCS